VEPITIVVLLEPEVVFNGSSVVEAFCASRLAVDKTIVVLADGS